MNEWDLSILNKKYETLNDVIVFHSITYNKNQQEGVVC